MKKNLKFGNKKGSQSLSSIGLTMALGSIFILGIGLPVTNSVIDDANLTGLTATVVGFSPVILGAAYLFIVAKTSGIVKGM